MAQFKFEGAIDDISARQVEYISSVLSARGYKEQTVRVDIVGKAGDNYVASVKRITVEKDGQPFKVIAKIASTNDIIRLTMSTAVMFRNEHIMYTEVLPKFTELEKSADIPADERLRYAECYGSLSEAPHEVILLEDLQVSHFTLFNKMESLSNESVKLVLNSLGKLHTLSYALKKMEPMTYAHFNSALTNLWSVTNQIEEAVLYFEHVELELAKVLSSDKHKKAIEGSLSKLIDRTVKNHMIDTDNKYSVIQQGDGWTNNIMFLLEDGDEPVSCCMIDYQISRNASPAADILYMLFNCTDYETRSKNFNEWIDYYHSELDKYLANFGLKANLVYPRDQLDADMRRYGKISFGLSALLASILLRETSESAEYKASMESGFTSPEDIKAATSMSNLDQKTIVRIKDRLEGLIDSFIELGYL